MKYKLCLKLILVSAALFILPQFCLAQFYVTGDDPGRLKWKSVDTDHYRIIYPNGDDSLAFLYGRNLEKYRNSVSRTTGYLTSGGWGTKMPVVLHTWNGENGSVAWAPKRMDLFTIPSPYSPEPLPWHKMLAIHENRHVSQMQFAMTRALKPFNYIFGEMFNIACSLFYPGISAMEGDAVITETAYSTSGRGRTAEFLNYYRIAFDQGINDRSYYKWRYGSQRFYVPNYYSLGYITIGGLRTLYDCPDFMYRVYELSARRPYDLGSYYTVIKDITGKKFKAAFQEITDSLSIVWKAEADARAPYTPFRQIVGEPRIYMDYSNPIVTEGAVYAFRNGFEHAPALVKVDGAGKEKFIMHISPNTSNITFNPEDGRLWWSESTTGYRWSLKSRSILHSYDINTGKKQHFRTNLQLHNPVPSPDGKSLATAQYSTDGKTGITIIDSDTGRWKEGHSAPDSLQIVQLVWKEDKTVYATAISEQGYGIYRLDLDEGSWNVVLGPQPVMVDDFSSEGEYLTFTSDIDGRNELYQFNPGTGELFRKTSSRYGATDFKYFPDGDSLVYAYPTLKGKILVTSPSNSLKDEACTFGQNHRYHLAEQLTLQEREYAANKGEEYITSSDSVSFSKPKKYSKLLHAFNIHSWAPVYLSVDKIMNMSFDKIYEAASLGFVGIMQNRLATAVGEFGYSAHKDPYDRSKWRHSAHAKFTYSGWLPVLEGSIDFNDRAARLYSLYAWTKGNSASISMGSDAIPIPSLQGKVSVYLPLKFNSGGWYRGFIPRITYMISNDCFDRSILVRSHDVIQGGTPVVRVIRDKRLSTMQSLMATARFYGSVGIPSSAVYPRWGGGVELGVYKSFTYGKYVSPMVYAYAYGYFPGFTRTQGLKLTGTYQQKVGNYSYFGQAIVSTLPRGFADASVLPLWAATYSKSAFKLSADYAIPVYIGELPIFGSFIYIKRLVITPHFDCSFFKGVSLYSAGLSAVFDLKTLCYIEWPCSIGVTASFNGSLNGRFKELKTSIDNNMGRFHIGPVFNVSF